MRLRRGDWIATYSVCIATLWTLGAWDLQREMPLAYPTPERICATYARSSDLAPARPAVSPNRLFETGVPFWATWVTANSVRPAAPPPDVYPACVDQAALRAKAEARHEAVWRQWRADHAMAMFGWAIAPFLAAPLVILTVVSPYVLFRRSLSRRRLTKPAAHKG